MFPLLRFQITTKTLVYPLMLYEKSCLNLVCPFQNSKFLVILGCPLKLHQTLCKVLHYELLHYETHETQLD